MLDLRKRIFITSSITVAIIIVIVLLYMFVFNTKDEKLIIDSQGNINQTVTEVNGVVPGTGVAPVEKKVVPPKTQPDDIYAKQVTRIFIERFQTYSNQNDNQHIEDVESLVTPVMLKWIKTQDLEQSQQYSGLTTKVVASQVDNITNTSASVSVDVQQIIQENGTVKTEYKSGRVELLKTENTWKVDGLYWE